METQAYKKKVIVIGGGTVSHVKSHLALTAIAYGTTARYLADSCKTHSDKLDVELHLTKMANSGQGNIETNEDVATLIHKLKSDFNTKIIFFNPALCDFHGIVYKDDLRGRGMPTESGKYSERLKTSELANRTSMGLFVADKIIGDIRKNRKDIFLVGFKTTCGATEDEQYIAGLDLLKSSSCNLVLANDVKTRTNMIITPEEARYHVTQNRNFALDMLVEMAYLRSHLSFTRSTVVAGNSIDWQSEEVPSSLRTVVNHCINSGAYKPFKGATVGHFACKVDDQTFLTSKRKTNFNDLDKIGLVKVTTDGPDTVTAYGAKPSVGGQSQRIIFSKHADKEYDCIVHFHCPIKKESAVPVVSQREFECGSHECGTNTSNGLKQFGNLSAVMLDNHGPNIVFNKNIDPQEVIEFINNNFDLHGKTGGMVSLDKNVTEDSRI